MQNNIILLCLALSLCSCKNSGIHNSQTPDAFNQYWHQGKAEITSYHLKQARYGQLHEGEAVLVFVTEPFSTKEHVKVNQPGKSGHDVTVLKLNHLRKFNTGIYPYSVMTSVFTPTDMTQYQNPLMISFSSQEWCGHVYDQLTLTNTKRYHYQLHSYFETENEEERYLKASLSEEALFTYIRLNPDAIPKGDVSILPSQQFSRFQHQKVQAYKAEISVVSGDSLSTLKVAYQNLPRTVEITFSSTFPYVITQWSETTKSGFGEEAKSLTTVATKNKQVLVDYWNKNQLNDAHWRQKLGLPQ